MLWKRETEFKTNGFLGSGIHPAEDRRLGADTGTQKWENPIPSLRNAEDIRAE